VPPHTRGNVALFVNLPSYLHVVNVDLAAMNLNLTALNSNLTAINFEPNIYQLERTQLDTGRHGEAISSHRGGAGGQQLPGGLGALQLLAAGVVDLVRAEVQSDKISHIDTVIFHINTVIFHIDTVILRSSPISMLSSSLSILPLSSCGHDDQIISCHSAEVASAAPPVMSPAHDALNAFFHFTDATGQGLKG